MSRLSQETIAVIGVGVALAVLFVTVTNDIRAEARADRAAFQAENARLREEARADRAAFQAESARLREEARADRTEARADREAWQAEMRKLRAEAGGDREMLSRLTGIVEGLRTANQ